MTTLFSLSGPSHRAIAVEPARSRTSWSNAVENFTGGLLCVLALSFVMAAGSAAAADLQWGVNGHPLAAYAGIPFERQLDHVQDLGMKSYRVDVADIVSAPQLGPAH